MTQGTGLYACYEVGSAKVPELLSKLFNKDRFSEEFIGKLVVTNFISDDDVMSCFHRAKVNSYVDEYFAVGIIKSLKNGGAYISFYEDEDQGKHQFFEDTRDLFFGFDPRLAGLKSINRTKIPAKDVVFIDNEKAIWRHPRTHYTAKEKQIIFGLVDALGKRVLPLLSAVFNRSEIGLTKLLNKEDTIIGFMEPRPSVKIEGTRPDTRCKFGDLDGLTVSGSDSSEESTNKNGRNILKNQKRARPSPSETELSGSKESKLQKIYKIVTCREDSEIGAHDFKPWGPYLYCSYCGEVKDFTVL